MGEIMQDILIKPKIEVEISQEEFHKTNSKTNLTLANFDSNNKLNQTFESKEFNLISQENETIFVTKERLFMKQMAKKDKIIFCLIDESQTIDMMNRSDEIEDEFLEEILNCPACSVDEFKTEKELFEAFENRKNECEFMSEHKGLAFGLPHYWISIKDGKPNKLVCCIEEGKYIYLNG